MDTTSKTPAQVIADRIVNRTITRRGVLRGAAVAGIGVAASSAFFVPNIGAQSKQKVTFWTTFSDIGLEALQQVGKDFNAQNQKYEVEIVKRPDADVTDSSSLITAVRGGQGPDSYLLDRFIVAERAANGLLEDLTPYMEKAGMATDLSDFVQFSATEATYDGKPYALPHDTDVRALFYNTKMFKDAGVDMSKLDKSTGKPITMDELAEISAKLDKKDSSGKYSQVGFIPYFDQGGSLYTWGFAFEGSFFDYTKCEVTPDETQVKAAAQWVYDYAKSKNAGQLNAFVQHAMRTGAAPTDSNFIQGTLGSMDTGNWQFQTFKKYIPNVEVGYTYTPVQKEGDPSQSWAGGWSVVVPYGAKNPEGGFEFAQYACGHEGSVTYTKLNNNLPVLKSLLGDKTLYDENLTWFMENVFPTTKNRPPLPVGAKYWDELKNAFQAIYLNQTSVDDALANCKKNVQQAIDQGKYCPIAPPAASINAGVGTPVATPGS